MQQLILSIVLCALLGTVFCKIDFSDSYEEEMLKVIKECQEDPDTRASDEWIETEDLETADKEGPHILCRLTKIGSLKEDGDIDVETMKKDLEKGIDDANIIETIVDKCGIRPPGLTATESAVLNFRCVLSTYKELTDAKELSEEN